MTDRPGQDRGAGAASPADTTSELWDRIADDLADRGRICAETVEKLIGEACGRPPGPDRDPEEAG